MVDHGNFRAVGRRELVVITISQFRCELVQTLAQLHRIGGHPGGQPVNISRLVVDAKIQQVVRRRNDLDFFRVGGGYGGAREYPHFPARKFESQIRKLTPDELMSQHQQKQRDQPGDRPSDIFPFGPGNLVAYSPHN